MNVSLQRSLAGFALLMAYTTPAWADICRVTTAGNGANSGSDWSVSMDFQTALGTTSCSEIWVAAGTYKPTSGTDQNASFVFTPGVGVYGGFYGTESNLGQRDPEGNVTVLSGDLLGDDDVNFVNNGENSYHVIRMVSTELTGPFTATTVLDGFTVRGGNAVDHVNYALGGGLACIGQGAGNECSPTLSNLIFIDNIAAAGGAIFSNGYDEGISRPTLYNVTFQGNHSLYDGGAFHITGYTGNIDPTLTNVAFIDNVAENGRGGAVYIRRAGHGTLTNITFSGNSAQAGGAICIEENGGPGSDLTLTNVTFNGNFAFYFGGAMYNSNSFPQLHNAILWGDEGEWGSEIYNEIATPTITNSIVQGGCPSLATCVNVIDSNPLLGPLQDNGGSALTMMPGSKSPAIDTGAGDVCPDTDQRGISRPQGIACDLGAVEISADDLNLIFANGFD